LETAVRLEQIRDAFSATFFGSRWAAFGLPTADGFLTLREQVTARVMSGGSPLAPLAASAQMPSWLTNSPRALYQKVPKCIAQPAITR